MDSYTHSSDGCYIATRMVRTLPRLWGCSWPGELGCIGWLVLPASYLVLPATNHMPCLEVSHATMVWFWVVCGMLLSMLHAEGDMVGSCVGRWN